MARRKWNKEIIRQIVDGQNPFIQSGYSVEKKHYKVGDQWTDTKGIMWEQRERYITRVNQQANSIRHLVKRICSECGKDLDICGERLDEKIYPKTGRCFDCVQAEEACLRLTGEYEKYENDKLLKNRLSALKEFREKVIESIDYLKKDDCKLNMVMSSGEIITWSGAQNESILKDAESDLEKSNEEINRVEKLISELSHPQKS